ncbi:MAG: GMP synthase [Acidimicrobiaceae bacterium]|nr:GMP synthase [Acidimicrobiaceae bacterium]|tara:strand:- start:2183 stop:2905 length:723 start_codon:yes stop_codon:yes gene_type:complete
MRLLVLQHIECEHPAQFRRHLESDGTDWVAVELDLGEEIPPLGTFDALWVMGGPMNVWDTDEHPWLVAEKAAIRQWVVDMERPFLGICLGHQLLADALDGRCGYQDPSEIGVLDVHLTRAGIADPIFAGLPPIQRALQWHSVQVVQPPPSATVLAESSACAIQAMRVGRHAWSMQYHIEVEPETVVNWGRVPAYRSALESTLGPDALIELETDAAETMADFNRNAELLYRNFMEAVQDPS